MNAQTLQSKLPKIEAFDKSYDVVMQAPLSFIDGDTLMVSMENGDMAGDYYGEYTGGYPYINPVLEKFAADNNGMWQWRDPSAIGFYAN